MRFKRIIAKLAVLCMVVSLCPDAFSVKADDHPDMSDAVTESGFMEEDETAKLRDEGIFNEEDVLSGLESGKDYVEGQVILIVREGSGLNCFDEDEGELPGNAEVLADATDVFRDNPLFLNETAGEETVLGASDKVEFKLVKSDEYTTAQLLSMYEDMPGVISVMPDRINYPEPITDTDLSFIFHEEDAAAGSLLEEETVSEKLHEDETVSGSISGDYAPDLTCWQYNASSGPEGVNVPNWNEPSKKNSEGTVVAVLDTGVDYDHPDLKSVMWDEGLDYPQLVAMGGTKYGYSADENSDSKTPMDLFGHGTHCAGIIAAAWDGKGISGIANGVKIMALNASIGANGTMPDSYILKCVDYMVAAKKAGVNLVAVNCSIGDSSFSPVYRYAAQMASKAGIAAAWASNNDSGDKDVQSDSNSYYYDIPGAVVVDASDMTGKKAFFSGYGVKATDIFAPGDLIFSTYTTGNSDINSVSPFSFDAAKLKKDGALAFDDFESDGGFFSPTVSQDCPAKVSTVKAKSLMGLEDNHVLKLEAYSSNENCFMYLDLGDELSVEKPKYLVYNSYYDDMIYDRFSFRIPLKNGKEKGKTIAGANKEWSMRYIELPEDTDYDNLRLKIRVDAANFDSVMFLDDIGFTNVVRPYEYQSGTSMATPVVTAALAIAASNFETDYECTPEAAAMRAARVIGSARRTEDLSGFCRSGGMVDISGMLDEDYSPVVEAAQNDDKTMTIKGYFFGEESGRVLIDGVSCAVLEWADRCISVSLPEALAQSDVRVDIETASGKSGMRYVAFTHYSDKYASLIPVDEMASTSIYLPRMLFAVNDAVYFGISEDEKTYMWKYDLRDKKWSMVDVFSGKIPMRDKLSYAYFGDYVLYTDEDEIYVFDKKIEKTVTHFMMEPLFDSFGVTLANVGSKVYAIVPSLWDEDVAVDRIDSVDEKKGEVTFTKVGTFKSMFSLYETAADSEGNIYVTDGNRLEKITIDPVTETVSSNMLKEKIFGDSVYFNSFDMVSVKDGFIFFGSMDQKLYGELKNDIYFLDLAGNVSPYPLHFSSVPVYNHNVIAYRNNVYLMATDRYSKYKRALAVMALDTISSNEDEPSKNPDEGKEPVGPEGEKDPAEGDDEGGQEKDAPEGAKLTPSDNKPMAVAKEIRDGFEITYAHEIPFPGKSKISVSDFGDPFTVSKNGVTFKVTKISVNKKKKLIRITGLEGADRATLKAVKKATRGKLGLPYKVNPYYVRDTDTVTVKTRTDKGPVSVKIRLKGKDYKAKKNEWVYDAFSGIIGFTGENLKGSYKYLR